MILVLNKNCEDEGWFEGEYNGKRGLFPENFVKLIEVSPAEKLFTNNNPTPPILPAKPNKTIASVSNATAPIASIRDISNNSTSSASNKSTASNIEERKSMIAGLQNKLFPLGKLPLQKPTPNHSPVGNSDKSEEPDTNKLSAVMKNRPKQNNKRPPSLNFHNNKMIEETNTFETVGSTKSEMFSTIKEIPLSPKSSYGIPSIKQNSPSASLVSDSSNPLINQISKSTSDYISKTEFLKFAKEMNQKIESLMNEVTELKLKISMD